MLRAEEPPADASAAAPPLTPAAAVARVRATLSEFLRAGRAYELLPASGKVVVFDTVNLYCWAAALARLRVARTRRLGMRARGAPLSRLAAAGLPYARRSSPSISFSWTPQDVPIRLALYALVEHETPAAPLWDSARGHLAGMLTVTDLCDIMRIFHVPGTPSTATVRAHGGGWPRAAWPRALV